MKNTVSLVVYVITFIAMYFVLSLFGSIIGGCDYSTVLEERGWFIMYSLFLGWWLALIPANDVYEDLRRKERV
jgi:hypothetical protein